MDNNDIGTVQEILTSLEATDNKSKAIRIENPALEVENSLVDFLKHRLTKLKKDVDFEDEVKNAVMGRLSEASFGQLITLLEVLQKNSNIGVEKVLAPFIASSGEKTILDSTKDMNRQTQAAEEIFKETDDKQILQSLLALNQMLDLTSKLEKQGEES